MGISAEVPLSAIGSESEDICTVELSGSLRLSEGERRDCVSLSEDQSELVGCIVRWTVIIRVRALVLQVDSTLATLHSGGASQHEMNGVLGQSRCIFVRGRT